MIRRKELLFFLIPALSYLIIFSIYPTIYTWFISFRSYRIFENKFVGFENYITLFKDSVFYVSLVNTLFYVVMAVGVEFLLGLAIALLFNQNFKGKSIAIIFLMLPMIIPPVVSALTFLMLYDPTLGLINYLINSLFGFSAVSWLTEPSTAKWAVVSIDVWQWTPFVALVLLAGLQYLPKETLEAARIDGANSFQLFYRITLPLIKKVIIIALLFRLVEAFKAFESIYITTKGGPGYATRTLNIYSYLKAFEFLKFGESSAMAIIMLFVASFLVMILIKVFRSA